MLMSLLFGLLRAVVWAPPYPLDIPSSIEQSAGPRHGPRQHALSRPNGPYPLRVDRACYAPRPAGAGGLRSAAVGERRTIDRNFPCHD
jgi:hypothetical protein